MLMAGPTVYWKAKEHWVELSAYHTNKFKNLFANICGKVCLEKKYQLKLFLLEEVFNPIPLSCGHTVNAHTKVEPVVRA